MMDNTKPTYVTFAHAAKHAHTYGIGLRNVAHITVDPYRKQYLTRDGDRWIKASWRHLADARKVRGSHADPVS